MRKVLKVLGLLLAAVIVLLVALAVALPFIVDPNEFKPRIEAAVEEATGRDLEIAGDIDLSVFPWLGVDLGAVQLGNAPGFGEKPFASIEGVQVRVKLLPLIAGNIEIGKVVVEQPVIRLQRNAEGRTNWEDLAGGGTGEADRQPSAPAEQPEFSIEGIEIRSAEVSYTDAVSSLEARLSEFDLAAGALGLPADFPLSMQGRFALSEPAVAGSFQFDGQVAANPASGTYLLSDGALAFEVAGKGLPVSPLDGKLEWQRIAADMTAGTASVDALAANVIGLQMNADVEASAITEAPQAKGRVAFAADDLGALATRLGKLLPEGLALSGPARGELGFAYDQAKGRASVSDARVEAAGAIVTLNAEASGLPETPKASGSAAVAIDDLAAIAKQLGSLAPEGLALDGPAKINARFSYDKAAGTASLPLFAANVLGIEIEANATASNLDDAARISGHIRTGEFSPGRLLVKLGQELPVTRDGKVLDLASLDTGFQATPTSAALENLVLRLDQSKLTGRVAVADFEKQALRFDLALDQIDVDRYLPPGEEQAAEETATTPLEQVEVPAELVRGLDIDGQLAIGKLKAFGFNSSDVKIGVKAQDDVLRLHPLEAKFYGGGYRGDMRVDARRDVPAVSVDEHVERIQLAPLVRDVFEVENLSGTAKMDVVARARGKTLGALQETLDGTFAVDVLDGAIEGFNLWESIREAYALLKGQPYDAGDAPDRTEFAELSATGKIHEGILENNDLRAKLPFLRVNGQGQVNIAEATLDYRIETHILKSPELKGDIEELTGTVIPVVITGPVMDPKVRPDVKGVLEQKAKEALERKEQELREKAKQKAEEEKERLEEKLKDKLKDFFG